MGTWLRDTPMMIMDSGTVPLARDLMVSPSREGTGIWNRKTYFVLGLFLEGTTLGVMVAIAACPSAAMITILSLRYGIDDTFASRVHFLSTILCAVTLPIMTYFLL